MNNKIFCSQCGASLKEGAAFCSNCGTKQAVANVNNTEGVTNDTVELQQSAVSNSATPTQGENSNQGTGISDTVVSNGVNIAQMKKYIPVAGIVLGAIIVIAIVLSILINALKYTKIDAQELCRVTFSGANDDGKATAGFAFDPATTYAIDNSSSLRYIFAASSGEDISSAKIMQELISYMGSDMYEDYSDLDDEDIKNYKDLNYSNYLSFDKKKLTKAFKKADTKSDAEDMRNAILENVEFELSDTKNLKNGDTIKVEVVFDKDELKDENIKLKNTKFEIKVKGIMNGEELDVFKDVKVDYTGYNGEGNAKVNTDACPDYVKDNFEFYLDDSYSLSNGDKNQIKAYLSDSGLYDYKLEGMVIDDYVYLFDIENLNKEITVEGLKDLEGVDPFNYVEIVYDGVYPSVRIKAEFKEDTPEYIVDNVELLVNYNSDDLEEGYKFSVTASDYWGDLNDEGYKLSLTEKDYVFNLADVPAYITDAKVIKKDTYKDLIDTAVTDEANSLVGKRDWAIYDLGNIDSVSSVKIKNVYVGINKDQTNIFGSKNVVYRLYEVNCKHTVKDKTSDGKFYIVGSVKNVTVNGTTISEIEASEINIKVFLKYDDAKEYSSVDENFTTTEIK